VTTSWTDPKTGTTVRVGDVWQDREPIYKRGPLRTMDVLGPVIDRVRSRERVRIAFRTRDYRWRGRDIKGHLVHVSASEFVKRFTLIERAPETAADAPSAAGLGPDRLITIRQAQDVFARFLLDRGDQYETKSPCWIALADAAQEVANGEAWADFEHGELDGEDLKRRVKSMARTPGARPVDPKLGTDNDGGRSA